MCGACGASGLDEELSHLFLGSSEDPDVPPTGGAPNGPRSRRTHHSHVPSPRSSREHGRQAPGGSRPRQPEQQGRPGGGVGYPPISGAWPPYMHGPVPGHAPGHVPPPHHVAAQAEAHIAAAASAASDWWGYSNGFPQPSGGNWFSSVYFPAVGSPGLYPNLSQPRPTDFYSPLPSHQWKMAHARYGGASMAAPGRPPPAWMTEPAADPRGHATVNPKVQTGASMGGGQTAQQHGKEWMHARSVKRKQAHQLVSQHVRCAPQAPRIPSTNQCERVCACSGGWKACVLN